MRTSGLSATMLSGFLLARKTLSLASYHVAHGVLRGAPKSTPWKRTWPSSFYHMLSTDERSARIMASIEDHDVTSSEDTCDDHWPSRSESNTDEPSIDDRIASLNGGIPLNCNSPKQVAAAVFGKGYDRSTSKSILQQAAMGAFPELDDRQRQLAALIVENRARNQRPTVSPVSSNEAAKSQAPLGDNHSSQRSVEDPIANEVAQNSRFNTDVSSYDSQIDRIFAAKNNQIDAYWQDSLRQVSRPSARALVAQLDPKQCPMGYDPVATPTYLWQSVDPDEPSIEQNMKSLTTTAGKKGSFLAFCREQKQKYSDCVLLTRCGDFYETFGIDAILLVEHCGLNAMAGKAKAGCPYRNIQATLDCLTNAGFRVAVFEEGSDRDALVGSDAPAGAKARIKNRFLAQIVSEASPTYLYDLVLQGNSADTLATGPSSRPYVGVIASLAGYTLTEVWLEERIVRVCERLTAESVACRLAAYPPADPLFYVPLLGSDESRSASNTPPFLASRMETSSAGPGVRLRIRRLPSTLVQKEGNGVSEVERAKNIVVSDLLRFTERQADDESLSRRRACVDDFTLVALPAASSGSTTQTNPLHLETAIQLGLMNDKAIPSLVSYLLPESAPAATRRFFRRLLLTPPPPHVAEAMSDLLAFLKHDGAPALPPLSIPPVGKVLCMIRAGQASAQVFGELLRVLDSTTLILDVLSHPSSNDVVQSLMVLLEYESGMAADPSSLRQRCLGAVQAIEDVLAPNHHVNVNRVVAQSLGNERVTNFGDLIPPEYFQRNEVTWRGLVRYQAAPEAYEMVQEAAEQLARAVAVDFWGMDAAGDSSTFRASLVSDGYSYKNLIVQDIFNNLFALKEIPKTQSDVTFVHPADRNGKILRNRYTTETVQSAISDYVTACDEAKVHVSAALVRLSAKLHDEGHLPAIVQASHTNLILCAAFYHSVEANALGWSLATAVEPSPDVDSAGSFNSLWPYWIDRSQAVNNTFELDGMWILTAPNMSGKSTIMRSAAAAALLTVCGLCAPLAPGSTIRRFDHIFVRGASSDIPTEQKSAFGAEMGDVASLLRCCGDKSLVFVDELGRGTSPYDGTRLSGAVLEAMAEAGMSGIFATHLHDILKLPLHSNNRITTKRMAIHDVDVNGRDSLFSQWTYRLEDGVCTDSMALITAKRFGLPASVIARADELSKFLPTVLENIEVFDDTNQRADPGPLIHELDIDRLVNDTLGQTAFRVAPHWNVPASYEGMSTLYVIRLGSTPPSYYVGESDNFRKRLDQHRAKGGHWTTCEAYVVYAKDKSVARMWESILIRTMTGAGYDMQSINDGRKLRTVNSL